MEDLPYWQELTCDEKDRMVKVLMGQPMVGTYLIQDGTFAHFNETAASIFGYEQHEVINKLGPFDLAAEEDHSRVQRSIQRRLEGRSKSEHYTFTGRCKDGSSVEIEASGTRLVLDEEPAIFGTFIDITERNRARQKIEHLVWYNDLTKLPNRKYLYQSLNQHLAGGAQYSDRLAAMIMEFPGLPTVRDVYGYRLADSLTRKLADSLPPVFPDSSLLYHLERDLFAAIISLGESNDPLSEAAEAVEGMLEEPLLGKANGSHKPIYLDVNIGAAVFPDHAEKSRLLVSRANLAMTNGRDESGTSFNLYTPGGSQKVRQRLRLSSDLYRALEQDELFLEYQPIFDLGTNRMTSIEALIRWDHPDLGLIAPGTLIPVAEQYGHIVDVDRHVMKTACRSLLPLTDGKEDLKLSANLSPSHFDDDHLAAWLRDTLETTGFPPDQLELEVTEKTVVRQKDNGRRILQELKESGLTLAIDDFGVGYSSFRYLRDLPVDTLKIDRSFIHPLDVDSAQNNLANILCSVGRRLNLTVVAEGVETREQLEYLRELGCRKVQGFLLSRPRSLDDLKPLFDQTIDELLTRSGSR